MPLLKDQLDEARRLRDSGFYNSAVIQSDNVVQICLVNICRARGISTALLDSEKTREREVLIGRLKSAGVSFSYEDKLRDLRRIRNMLEHPEAISQKNYAALSASKEWAVFAVVLVEKFLASIKLPM